METLAIIFGVVLFGALIMLLKVYGFWANSEYEREFYENCTKEKNEAIKLLNDDIYILHKQIDELNDEVNRKQVGALGSNR
jgi:hypothetical protein